MEKKFNFKNAKVEKLGVAETNYEFKCRDVPWNVSTGVLTSLGLTQ
ncbi:hypothetical protein BDGGKGIB_04249 [Nodularia sphaerocarpa UHCC 0038]|nr:hypothetical protein BDGGKGIB_04249 [Nodularia sphaerocarpa UHCC 0038]